jgi:thymidylate kinase
MAGQLIVFEGPDGSGKTTLSKRLVDWLAAQGKQAQYVSFPGREQGTLGSVVYDIHHSPEQFGLVQIEPTARQLLHVAAHIDALRTSIVPALEADQIVVLDRFWWSTLAYGTISGVDETSIRLMVKLEELHWAGHRPFTLFLLERFAPAGVEHAPEIHGRLQSTYAELARAEDAQYPIVRISTDCRADDSFKEILSTLKLSLQSLGQFRKIPARQRTLLLPLEPAHSIPPPALAFSKMAPAVPSQVYDTYWRFAAKRQEVFFRRIRRLPPPWTDDSILCRFKFTNAYRASDRASQYLIRHVIYSGDQDPGEVFFRTLLFKIFNKIETWKLLKSNFGQLTIESFDLHSFDQVLVAAMARKQAIYSGAYIMPSGGRNGDARKHLNHLKLLRTLLLDGVPQRMTQMRTMREVYETLLSYPMIGQFLAYQYATDVNYSSMTNFDEMEFVVPGPGARDGIRKCFRDLGGFSEADIIKMVADKQELEFERLDIDFQSLWGRPLQLIDCQNLFCEVDKYARYAHPEVEGITGRSRIKQIFRSTDSPIDYWYPPKWGINGLIGQELEATRAGFRS